MESVDYFYFNFKVNLEFRYQKLQTKNNAERLELVSSLNGH